MLVNLSLEECLAQTIFVSLYTLQAIYHISFDINSYFLVNYSACISVTYSRRHCEYNQAGQNASSLSHTLASLTN